MSVSPVSAIWQAEMRIATSSASSRVGALVEKPSGNPRIAGSITLRPGATKSRDHERGRGPDHDGLRFRQAAHPSRQPRNRRQRGQPYPQRHAQAERHGDGVAGVDLAAYDAAREGVLDVAPYGPRQRSRAELRVVALLGEELLRGVGHLDLDALAFQVLVQAREHDVHDLQHVLPGEGMEDDDLIYSVEELRLESSLERFPGPPLGLAEVHAVARGEAELPRRDEVLAAYVRGHYDDRVLEVDGPALGIREAPVVEDLQESVEDVRVGLLDLVEEDDRVGSPADLLRELSRLFVADVARRRADQARHRV